MVNSFITKKTKSSQKQVFGSTSGSKLSAFIALTSIYFMQFLACNGCL